MEQEWVVFERIIPERHSWILTAGSMTGSRWRGVELDVEKQRIEPAGLRTESECPSNPRVSVKAALYSPRDHRVPKGTLSWGQLTGVWLWRTGSPNAGARNLCFHRAARWALGIDSGR